MNDSKRERVYETVADLPEGWINSGDGDVLKGILSASERIADALEAQVRPAACDEPHSHGGKCILDDRHVGHHVTADGRYHWLDDE